jgi:hypothetical protein
LTVVAVTEKQDIAEHRALEAERAEKCRRRRQREEEAENWMPEHDNKDEGGLDDNYSGDKDDTMVHVD